MNIFDEEIQRLQKSKKQAEKITKEINEQNSKIEKAETTIEQAQKQKAVHYQTLIELVETKKAAADLTGTTTKEINQCLKLRQETTKEKIETPAPTGYKQTT